MVNRGGGEDDAVLDEQWKVHKARVAETGAFKDSLIVCDVSGSMAGTPMEVAIALGLLGMNDNRLITFHESPTVHTIPDGSLREQVKRAMAMPWGGSTNIEKVFDIVLEIAKSEGPIKRIFVFSDMQFDAAFYGGSARNEPQLAKTQFERAQWRFANANLPMPQMVYWNLNGSTKDFPVRSNEAGVIMLSGFSPSLLKSVMDNTTLSPLHTLLATIRVDRYNKIQAPASYTPNPSDSVPPEPGVVGARQFEAAPAVSSTLAEMQDASPVSMGGKAPGCFSCLK
jgi:hypothetical protein